MYFPGVFRIRILFPYKYPHIRSVCTNSIPNFIAYDFTSWNRFLFFTDPEKLKKKRRLLRMCLCCYGVRKKAHCEHWNETFSDQFSGHHHCYSRYLPKQNATTDLHTCLCHHLHHHLAMSSFPDNLKIILWLTGTLSFDIKKNFLIMLKKQDFVI